VEVLIEGEAGDGPEASGRPGTLIVTGGSRGIGAEIAKLAASRGYAVCINYRSNEEAARSSARAAEVFGVPARIFRADISREDEVKEAPSSTSPPSQLAPALPANTSTPRRPRERSIPSPSAWPGRSPTKRFA
jgi:short chain dehydrogenase